MSTNRQFGDSPTHQLASRGGATVWRALRRGFTKRCPHCGEGRLFSGWSRHLDRCSVCGLVYERNPGDTWAFTVIGDRLPVAAIVVLIYFGYGRTHQMLGLITFAILGVLLVVSAPNRWGVGIALHYLSRVYWPDPHDPVPTVFHEETKQDEDS